MRKPGQNLLLARSLQFGLDDSYYQYMLTGGTGQPSNHEPDARLNYFGNDASHLPNGPF